MDPTKLQDRLREIVAPAKQRAAPTVHMRFTGEVDAVLGGCWRQGSFVVERRIEPSSAHGRATVASLAAHLHEAAGAASLLAGTSTQPPFLFFDLETTGLSGGAGTYAFLIGCGWFEGDGGFCTRQHLLVRLSDERALLETVGRDLAAGGVLVSFNGKSFDAPLLETRYLFHRLEWAGAGLAHLDALHPSRRFWGGETADCSLGALERHVLGACRRDDVPGLEIPARYFQFVRSGDARPLAAVLEHNRLDLLSLAGLTARLLELVHRGVDTVQSWREAFALGHLYLRSGDELHAVQAYERANALSEAPSATLLRSLALAYRRLRRHDDAAACWNRILAIRDCPGQIGREALEALAIYHEHRRRDFCTAKSYALRTLESGPRQTWQAAIRHRLARLEKKAERELANARLRFLSSPSQPSFDSPTFGPRTSS